MPNDSTSPRAAWAQASSTRSTAICSAWRRSEREMADDIRQHRLTCSYYVPVSLTIRQAFNRFIRFRERAVGIHHTSVRASFPAQARAERSVLRGSCTSVDIEASPAPAKIGRELGRERDYQYVYREQDNISLKEKTTVQ